MLPMVTLVRKALEESLTNMSQQLDLKHVVRVLQHVEELMKQPHGERKIQELANYHEAYDLTYASRGTQEKSTPDEERFHQCSLEEQADI